MVKHWAYTVPHGANSLKYTKCTMQLFEVTGEQKAQDSDPWEKGNTGDEFCIHPGTLCWGTFQISAQGNDFQTQKNSLEIKERAREQRSDIGAEVAAGISMTRFKIGRRYAEKEPHKSDRNVLRLSVKYLNIRVCKAGFCKLSKEGLWGSERWEVLWNRDSKRHTGSYIL